MLKFKLITVATSLILLTACQTLPEKNDSSSEVETVTPVVKKETPPVKKEQLTAIDSYTLYLLLTGEIALQRKQYEVGLEAYLQAAKRVKDVRIAEKAAQIGMYLDNLPQTEKAVSLWVDKDDKNLTARRIGLSTALNTKNQAQLLKHLNAILKNSPAEFENTLFDLEKILKSESEIKFVYQALETMAKQHPKQAVIPLAESLLAVRQKNVDLALHKVQQALAILPTWEKAQNFESELMIYSGKLAFKNKQYTQAIAWFDKVKPGKLSFEATTLAVGVLMDQKRFAEAATRLEQLLEKEKEPSQRQQLLIMQAELQSMQKNYQQAFDILTEALKEDPDSRDVLYARSLTAEKLNNMAQMEADLLKILAKEPDDAVALNALGYALIEHTNRYDDAEKYLERAIKLKPNDAMIADSYGWLQFKKGNLESALKYLQAAHKKLPENEITAHLAETLWMLGRKQEAEALFNEALKKTPNDEILLEFQQRVLKTANELKQ